MREIEAMIRWNVSMSLTLRECSQTARRFIEERIRMNLEIINAHR